MNWLSLVSIAQATFVFGGTIVLLGAYARDVARRRHIIAMIGAHLCYVAFILLHIQRHTRIDMDDPFGTVLILCGSVLSDYGILVFIRRYQHAVAPAPPRKGAA